MWSMGNCCSLLTTKALTKWFVIICNLWEWFHPAASTLTCWASVSLAVRGYQWGHWLVSGLNATVIRSQEGKPYVLTKLPEGHNLWVVNKQTISLWTQIDGWWMVWHFHSHHIKCCYFKNHWLPFAVNKNRVNFEILHHSTAAEKRFYKLIYLLLLAYPGNHFRLLHREAWLGIQFASHVFCLCALLSHLLTATFDSVVSVAESTGV